MAPLQLKSNLDFSHIFMEAIIPERNLLEQWGTLQGRAGRGKSAL